MAGWAGEGGRAVGLLRAGAACACAERQRSPPALAPCNPQPVDGVKLHVVGGSCRTSAGAYCKRERLFLRARLLCRAPVPETCPAAGTPPTPLPRPHGWLLRCCRDSLIAARLMMDRLAPEATEAMLKATLGGRAVWHLHPSVCALACGAACQRIAVCSGTPALPALLRPAVCALPSPPRRQHQHTGAAGCCTPWCPLAPPARCCTPGPDPCPLRLAQNQLILPLGSCRKTTRKRRGAWMCRWAPFATRRPWVRRAARRPGGRCRLRRRCPRSAVCAACCPDCTQSALLAAPTAPKPRRLCPLLPLARRLRLVHQHRRGDAAAGWKAVL